MNKIEQYEWLKQNKKGIQTLLEKDKNGNDFATLNIFFNGIPILEIYLDNQCHLYKDFINMHPIKRKAYFVDFYLDVIIELVQQIRNEFQDGEILVENVCSKSRKELILELNDF